MFDTHLKQKLPIKILNNYLHFKNIFETYFYNENFEN
jgi:hypothetical protein